MRRRGIGLEWRIGLLMSALAAGLIVVGIGALWVRTQRLTAPELEGAVLRAGDQVVDAVAARLDRLDLITRLLANDPPFRAYVAEGHVPSILDNLQDRRLLYALDAFVITDALGAPLADTRWTSAQGPAAGEGTRLEAPLPVVLGKALGGESARGLWVEPRGDLYLAAAAPLLAGDAAAVVALEAVDGSLASDLRQATGAELIFFSGEGDALEPGASTLPLSRSQLRSLLSEEGHAAGEISRNLDTGGEEFVARTALLSGDDERPAGFVVLRSVDRELASFRKIQATLLLVGLAAVPVALLLGALVARRITRPLAALVRATERVRDGEYDADLPPETHDEVGVLAGAFRVMLARLKQREELDHWIGAMAARVAGGAADAYRGGGDPSAATTARLDRDRPDAIALSGLPTRGAARGRPEPGNLRPGDLLQDRFRILGVLGAGGMGTVWQARDERLGETVAIKILPAGVMAAHPERVERFRQEIRLARRITHRNVLRTHELLEIDGAWAILMEHVDGVPLNRMLAAGPLPVAAAMRIARQICDGLEAAHAQGVVHRDLKPANVLVDTAGVVRIADFGLARAVDAGDPTMDGAVVGTPQYMSPEQALGRPVDHRTDIYSAGVVLYEMFCGRPPFDAEGALAVMRAHAEDAPPPPRSVNPALDPRIEAVLLRALAKDPSGRPASARELAEALESASESRSDPRERDGPVAHPSRTALLAFAALLAITLRGDVARAESAPPEEDAGSVPAGRAPDWRVTGDAFFRFEAVRDAPNPRTANFDRAWLRLRPGLEATLASGRVVLGAGIIGHISTDSNEENGIRQDNFISNEMAIDRAYLRLAAPRHAFTATLGLAPSPFGGTSILWDRDIRFAGVLAGAELIPAGALVGQRIYGGVSVGSQNHENGSVVAAVRWEGEIGNGLSIGAAFWYYGNTEDLVQAGYARTNRLAPGGEDLLSDFDVVNLSIGQEWLGARRPLRLGLDLLFNPGAANRRWGAEVRFAYGQVQALGSWRFALFLQRVEQDAALAAFGADEWWFRTFQRGARAALAFGLPRRAFVEVAFLVQRRDGLDAWLDRATIDFGMQF